MKKFLSLSLLGLMFASSLGLATTVLAAGWVSVPTVTSQNLTSIDCISATICVAGGNGGVIIRTVDGKTWSTVSSGTTEDILSIDLDGSGFGVAVGTAGFVASTVDSGATWTVASGATATDGNIRAVSVVSSTVAYFAQDSSNIYKTSNSGASWTKTSGSLTIEPRALKAISANTVYVAGVGGVMYYSTTSGNTWSSLSTGTTDTIYALDMFLTGGTGYIGGANHFFAKTTNGTTWTPVTLSGFGASETITAVRFGASVSSVYAVGNSGNAEETSDGSAWTSSGSAFSVGLNGVSAPTSTARFVVGNSGRVFSYDSTAPSTPTNFSLSTGSSYANSATPTFTWAASTDTESSAAPTYNFQIDGGTVYTVSSTTEVSPVSLAAGSHTASVTAIDSVGNASAPATLSFTLDFTPPTMSGVSPSAVSTGVATNFYMTVSDSASGVRSCTLYVNGTGVAAMSLSGGYYYAPYTFAAAGSNSIYASCSDNAGNTANSASTTVTVSGASSSDVTPPTVGTLSPASTTTGVSTTFTTSVSDAVGVTSCSFYSNSTYMGSMALSGTTASYTIVFGTAGSYSVYARCYDAAGNATNSSSLTVTVSGAATADTTAPTVGSVSPTSVVQNATTSLTATFSDASGVTACYMYLDGAYFAQMSLSGTTSGTASLSYTSGVLASHTFYARCNDVFGNSGSGPSTTVTISAATTTSLTVGSVSPTVAVANVATMYSVSFSDTYTVNSCHLVINGVDYGSMSISGSTASVSHTLTATGAHTVYVRCSDSAGQSANGPATSVYVYSSSTATANPGQLMKLQCAANAGVNDPCKAVYYYGSDGKRHAFPNEAVFYTWYANFNSVVTVDSSFLASLTLGRNVTYHAGVKMVKFVSVNTVYAVQAGGYLLPISSESVASALYGSAWNKNVDDISDAFYSNYRFGGTISNASSYSVSGAIASEATIDQDLEYRD